MKPRNSKPKTPTAPDPASKSLLFISFETMALRKENTSNILHLRLEFVEE